MRGAGRFVEIGLPAPEFLSYFVAVFEIICGMLIILGLFTRYAAVPLIIIMLVALSTTKVPVLIHDGFWSMVHAARTDWSMLLGSLFLFRTGPGNISLDAYRAEKADADD